MNEYSAAHKNRAMMYSHDAQTGSLITALKEMHESFWELAEAHSDHASAKFNDASHKLLNAVSVGYLIGPIVTVLLGTLSALSLLYFGFPRVLEQAPAALPTFAILVLVLIIAAMVAAWYVKKQTRGAKADIQSIKREFKQGLRLVEERHG